MTKRIITHGNSFHADEVTGCALLKIFKPEHDYVIERIPHQAEIPENADYVLDVGRKFDGIKYFDHHQREESDPMFVLSSAGLIWQYLCVQDQYPSISKFIELIDQNDVGIRKASSFEYPRIIGSYNTNDIYDADAQYSAFLEALQVAMTVIKSMKEYQDELDATESTLIALYDSRTPVEIDNGYIVLPHYLKGWDIYINGQTTPDVRCVTWPTKSEDSEEWQAQVIPTEPGKYGLHGKRFDQDESMTFVHSNGFFCVAPNSIIMLNYLS